MNKFKAFLSHPVVAIFIFYGWNILGILSLVILEINVHPMSYLIRSVVDGYTPWVYLVQVLGIVLIPISCFIVGIWRFKTDYRKLLRWFYGVEVPLLVLGIIRIAAVNDLNGHAFYFFVYILAAVLAYAFYLFYPDRFKGRSEIFFRTCFFAIGLQVICFLLLYIIPFTAFFFEALSKLELDDITELISAGFMAIIVALFLSLSGTLFFLSPFAFFWMWVLENLPKLGKVLKEQPALRYIGVASLCVCVWILYPSKQAQEKAFEAYESYKLDKNPETILNKESAIRAGLVNAYLNNYRYIDRKGQPPVAFLYEEAFGKEWAFGNDFHNFLIDPLLYHGNKDDDNKASLIYQELFDAPIERAESKPIKYTLGSAFEPREGEATLLSIDQKEVLVTNRDITYKEIQPGYVQVDFHERYINKTTSQQEVFYYFSMPESGVITGMWLGDTDSEPRAYQGAVAPRGAAQAVYQEIRAVRQDPALLEQVGPNQFRLRVFPIPARPWERFAGRFEDEEDEAEPQRPMHLTLRMLIRADEEGKIQLPILNEKRKVYWEDDMLESGSDEDWFPTESPQFSKTTLPHQVQLNGWRAEQKSLSSLPTNKQSKRYVVCYDASFSMNKHKKELMAALKSFPYKFPNKWNAPLYSYGINGLQKEDWDKKKELTFIGAVDPYQALAELQRLHPDENLLFICDKGSYELMPDTSRTLQLGKGKIDIIHLNEMAPIYEDALADGVRQSGGDMYLNMESWVRWHDRLPDESHIGMRDGDTYWTFQPDSSLQSEGDIAALAASRLAMAQSKNGNLAVSDMDSLHHLAMKYGFVSPYSSLICLVNEEQKRRLEELSRADDRYQREVETGNETGSAFDISAKGVPEPEEWVMIILVSGCLLFLYWKERRKRVA